MLAATTSVSWLVGALTALLGLWLGVRALRALAARRIAWWPALAGPFLAAGLVVGLLLVDLLEGVATGPFADDARWPSRLAWSLVLFFGVTSVFGLARAFLSSRQAKEAFGFQIPALVLDGARIVLWIAMILVIVGAVWDRTDWFGGFLTVAGASTLIVVLVLQDTIKNFISGVAIVGEDMFGIGDWVWIGDEEGEVVEITRRTTKIRTRAADLLVVPNVMVTSSKVRNQSHPTPVHAEFLFVHASYDSAPTRVREILRHAVLEVPKVLREPAPVLRVLRYGDSGVEYQVKIFVSDLAGIPDIKSDCMAQIWYHFRREGVEIPYPVREIRRRAGSGRTTLESVASPALARLRSVPFFAGLPDDLLTALADAAIPVEYGAGEAVVHQGEAGNACFVVDRGRLAVLVSDGREEKEVALLDPGALFGEMSLLTGEARSATVRVLADARLYSIRAPALKAALEKSPDLAHALAEAATLRKEGLLEARAELDSHSRVRVQEGTKHLGTLIRRFFRVSDGGD